MTFLLYCTCIAYMISLTHSLTHSQALQPIVMPDMLHTLFSFSAACAVMYLASWGFCSSRGLYSANPCFVFRLVFRPWQEKIFLSGRPLHLLTGVDSAEFLRGAGAERTVCVCVCWEAEDSRIHLQRKRKSFAGSEFFVLFRHLNWLNPPSVA
jgi:hypothetical protein